MDDFRKNAGPLILRGPQDLVAAVPYLLGFHPSDSLVAVGSGGPHVSCALRFDLPLGEEAAHHLAVLLEHHGFPRAMLAGYGPAELVTPAIELAKAALGAASIDLVEAVRITGERYWSYLCSDPSCCPAEGVRLTTTPLAAQAVVDGLVALPCRSSLAATISPVSGPIQELMLLETDLAETQISDRITTGLSLVRRLMAPDAALPSPREIARLGVTLTSLRVRDEAWVRTDPESPARHLALWRHILRRTAPAYIPAPACLFAYTAYISGDGGLANLALDVCDAVRPGYSMSDLLRQAMISGLHPSEAIVRLSPEDLAEAYRIRLARPPDPA